MKKSKNKGFTLAELLIVVAIIAVLVAISIPIFTSQLEKAREATDAANIRSQYAEVMTEAITDGSDVNGKTIFGAVQLKQAKDDWQDTGIASNLNSTYSQVNGSPKAGGTAWVEYKSEGDQVILHYEDASGNTISSGKGDSESGGKTETGSNTGNDSGSTNTGNTGTTSGSGGTLVGGTDISSVINQLKTKATPWPEKGGSIKKTERGMIITYQGKIYISKATNENGWDFTDWWYNTPEQTGQFVEVTDNAKVFTSANANQQGNLSDLNFGDLFYDSGTYYIYHGTNQGISTTNPIPSKETQGNWIKILTE